MTAMQHVSLGAHYAVHLPAPDDFAFWRERARGLIQCDVPPDRVSWVEPGGTGDLFAPEGPSRGDKRLPVPPADAPPVRRATVAVVAGVLTSAVVTVVFEQIFLVRLP